MKTAVKFSLMDIGEFKDNLHKIWFKRFQQMHFHCMQSEGGGTAEGRTPAEDTMPKV